MPASTPAPGGLAQPLSDLFDAVPPDWREVTEPFHTSPVGQALTARVDAACRQGTTVYPADVFAALRHTRRSLVKVVILGQDPYHGPGGAPRRGVAVAPGAPQTPPPRTNPHAHARAHRPSLLLQRLPRALALALCGVGASPTLVAAAPAQAAR